MPSAIDMVYQQLNQLFGGSKTQVFCMEFPGRVLNEALYAYDATSKYSVISKPHGERLSAVYEQALNMLIPKFYDLPQFDKDKAKMRDWLLELVDDMDPKAGPCKKTRVQLYEDLAARYLAAKLQWQDEKNAAWEKAMNAQDRDRAMEEYARWVAREAPVREADTQRLYNDLVIRGYYHEIGNLLGYLDVALESELIEQGKQGMRNASMSSLDESETIYPVYFEPNDWFKGLSTDFTPMDLLVDPEFLTARLMTKQKELEGLEVEYGRLQASRTGDVEAPPGSGAFYFTRRVTAETQDLPSEVEISGYPGDGNGYLYTDTNTVAGAAPDKNAISTGGRVLADGTLSRLLRDEQADARRTLARRLAHDTKPPRSSRSDAFSSS